MARLHIQYREETLDDRIVMLTKRFMDEHPWRRGKDRQRLFDTRIHGACIVYGLPIPVLKVYPQLGEVGRYVPAVRNAEAQILLHRYSLISLFHQFRHHMQEHTPEQPYKNENEYATDAQAWACSLFYVCDPHRFRRQVRKGRVSGVFAQDLLKRRRRA